MSQLILKGVSGANPLGFMATIGLLRLLQGESKAAKVGFLSDGTFHPYIERFDGDLASVVANDAARPVNERVWFLEYEKSEKNGMKRVADLKAPPEIFASFLDRCVDEWLDGEGEAAAFAAAFGTSVAVDGKGNTKPTAFHFTAANQQFLGAVEMIRSSVTKEWASQSLFEGAASRTGTNLRWDPGAERNWALMANNPTVDGTSVDAPLEWLAFRGLPLFPSFPKGDRIVTTAVRGFGNEMALTWPLWNAPISLNTLRSVLQTSWGGAEEARRQRGVFAMCSSVIRRTSQGFGNFGPAIVTT